LIQIGAPLILTNPSSAAQQKLEPHSSMAQKHSLQKPEDQCAATAKATMKPPEPNSHTEEFAEKTANELFNTLICPFIFKKHKLQAELEILVHRHSLLPLLVQSLKTQNLSENALMSNPSSLYDLLLRELHKLNIPL
jgi:hypothetical protein